MWTRRAAALFGCLAALPLFGCAGNVGTARSQPVPPAIVAAAAALVYPTRDMAAPAAILVVLPGAGVVGGDPALWAAQGFDVVTPPPAAVARLAADEDAALVQLVASAHRLASAPLWLVGPSPLVEAALAAPGIGAAIGLAIGPGQVSGVVVTSAGSNLGSCTESFSYFDAGNGTPPKVGARKTGNACPPGAALDVTGSPALVPPSPAVRPNGPKVIEASVAPDVSSPSAHRALVRQIAERIKASAG